MTAATKALSATAGVLGRLIDGVYAGLATVADEAARIMSAAEVSRGMLEPLKPVVERFVRAQDGLVDSAGASTVPGQLTDAKTWHQWWSLVDGQLIFITHNLNPASVNYYDYADMTRFERPVTPGHL